MTATKVTRLQQRWRLTATKVTLDWQVTCLRDAIQRRYVVWFGALSTSMCSSKCRQKEFDRSLRWKSKQHECTCACVGSCACLCTHSVNAHEAQKRCYAQINARICEMKYICAYTQWPLKPRQVHGSYHARFMVPMQI